MKKGLITFLFILFVIISAVISQFSDIFFYATMIFIGLTLAIFPDFFSNNLLYLLLFHGWPLKPLIKKDSGFYTFSEFFGERIAKVIMRVFGILILLLLIPIYFVS